MSVFVTMRALQRQAALTRGRNLPKVAALLDTTLLEASVSRRSPISAAMTSAGSLQRSSSRTYTSPLDETLDPEAPCPLFGTPRSVPILRPKRNILECGMEEDKLKFKSGHYGKLLDAPFMHPYEHKIWVYANLDDLPLDDLGKQILRQAVGYNRYNVKKNELKMSCLYFPSRIENKRYLVHMLDRLILSCQRLAKSLPPEGEPPAPKFVPGYDEEKAIVLKPKKPETILGSTERSMGGFKKHRSR